MVWTDCRPYTSLKTNLKPAKLIAGFIFSALGVLAIALPARGDVTIQGVLPAAADQPQTNAELIDPTTGQVVSVTGFDPITGDEESVYDIQAFLDTGTSGTILSLETQEGLNLPLDTYQGQPIEFEDTAIGGFAPYNVTVPYSISLAPFSIDTDQSAGGVQADPSAFSPATVNPVHIEANPNPADELVGPIDIMGMSVLQNKVAVFDFRPANSTSSDPLDFGETVTYVYNPGTPFTPATLDTNPGIVPTEYHVKVSYADFSKYTVTLPTGAPSPQQYANPMIGPNPLHPQGDNTPPVTIGFNGLKSTGSFLFDTGAAASFISNAEANNLGVEYGPGVDSNGDPYLINATTKVAIPNQFTLSVEGADGSTIESAGFYLDTLSLQTVEGAAITFEGAPVLVQDITLDDGVDPPLTLDGDLGMNFFEPSLDVNTLNEVQGGFDWMTFDQANGLIGLQVAGDPLQVPEPAALSVLFGGLALIMRRPRKA